jgi:hypothetical protein
MEKTFCEEKIYEKNVSMMRCVRAAPREGPIFDKIETRDFIFLHMSLRWKNPETFFFTWKA